MSASAGVSERLQGTNRVVSARAAPPRGAGTATSHPRTSAAGTAIFTVPAKSRFDFARGDRVLESVGVEAVAPALGCLRLRVHEEPELAALSRVRQRHVVRRVEGEPVALPSAEEFWAHGLYQRVVDLQPLARFFAR